MPATAKEQMLEIIREQPDDSSYDELLRELAFERMVERGFDDADHGRTIGNEEMDRYSRTLHPAIVRQQVLSIASPAMPANKRVLSSAW